MKSMWSPKLPGRVEVVKYCGFSKTKCVLVNFLFTLSLYSLIIPNLLHPAFLKKLLKIAAYIINI